MAKQRLKPASFHEQNGMAYLRPVVLFYAMPGLGRTCIGSGRSLTKEQQQGPWTSHAAVQLALGAVAHLGNPAASHGQLCSQLPSCGFSLWECCLPVVGGNPPTQVLSCCLQCEVTHFVLLFGIQKTGSHHILSTSGLTPKFTHMMPWICRHCLEDLVQYLVLCNKSSIWKLLLRAKNATSPTLRFWGVCSRHRTAPLCCHWAGFSVRQHKQWRRGCLLL